MFETLLKTADYQRNITLVFKLKQNLAEGDA